MPIAETHSPVSWTVSIHYDCSLHTREVSSIWVLTSKIVQNEYSQDLAFLFSCVPQRALEQLIEHKYSITQRLTS